ncbi:hypothetical protein ACXN5S_06010 [Pseudoroseicyclus sp. H15]
MRRLALSFLLAASPAFADDSPAEPLRALLAELPTVEGPAVISYTAPGLVADLSDAPGPVAATEALRQTWDWPGMPDAEAVIAGLLPAMGLRPPDLRELLVVTGAGMDWRLLRVRGIQSQRIGTALEARGYILAPGFGAELWALGAEGGVEEPVPGDPLGGAEGTPSRIAITEDLVRRAPSWPQIIALIEPEGASLAEMPELQRLLAGLDEAEGAVLARALIRSDGPGGEALLLAELAGQGGGLLVWLSAPDEIGARLRREAKALPGAFSLTSAPDRTVSLRSAEPIPLDWLDSLAPLPAEGVDR